MSEAVALWHRACEILKTKLHGDLYDRWIAVIEPRELKENVLTLSVGNDFYQSWLEEHYLPLMTDAVRLSASAPISIAFVVDNTMTPASEPAQPARTKGRRSSRDKTALLCSTRPLNPKFTFDEFIVGPSNSFPHAAALAVAQAPARAYNPLFIYGPTGLGKTHLMQAIGHYVMSKSHATVCYVSCEEFTNEYIDALQNRSLHLFRKKYRTADLLLIDDIHFLIGKEQLQQEFFHTFNALFDAHKQIVISSDRPACEITSLEERLVSRFEWGQVTELESPDVETRIAILRHKMSQARVTLPQEFITFIAQNIKANIRRLEGALVRTISYTSLTGRTLDIEGLRNLLRDMLDVEKQEELTFDRIQRTVAEHYDVRIADMTSKRRPANVAIPRQIAMYLCRSLTPASLPDIANAFSKTHATVLHAYRTVENRMDVDSDLRDSVHAIAKRLGRPLQAPTVSS